jgi:hypothetical protein
MKKLSSLTLATALALAGSAAFAQATVERKVEVGPNGEVTHVTKRVETPSGNVHVVRKVRRVETTGPVVVHRRVVYEHPYYHHHHHVVYVAPPHHHHHNVAVVHKEIVRRG